MRFIDRENEILRIIKSIREARLDFIVVGGYAVSGLARHRFSVDCDIVFPKKKLEEFENILKREGFKKHIEKAGFDRIYSGKFVSYKKEVGKHPVTFDMLVGSLVCRATEAAWSFGYIKRHSTEANILGTEASVTCRVPQRELLIALKIHSARRADIRDIIMLRENADLNKVLKYLKRGRPEALKAQIQRIIEALKDERLVDSLNGVFTLTADVKKQIESARKDMESLLKTYES